MKASTELFLYKLSWGAGKIMHPTWRNLDESFEGWAYRGGDLRVIRDLEARALVEARTGSGRSGTRELRLTRLGHLHVMGGADPAEEWSKPWDGKWRFALFDLPESERRIRSQLRRALAGMGFGCLQRSVWVTPRPMVDVLRKMKGRDIDVNRLVFVEGELCGGEKPDEIAPAAWDFNTIDHHWRRLATHLASASVKPSAADPAHLAKWAAREFQLWRKCALVDPFLPKALHPKGYQGPKIWRKRLETLEKLRKNRPGI